MINAYERVYLVTFNEYTDGFRKHVKLDDDENKDSTDTILDLPDSDLLVRESELATYIKFGKGFAAIRYVGEIAKFIS